MACSFIIIILYILQKQPGDSRYFDSPRDRKNHTQLNGAKSNKAVQLPGTALDFQIVLRLSSTYTTTTVVRTIKAIKNCPSAAR
ncbi:hypothetical protein PR003_g32684, partial [Phytophthora rubi]